MSNLDVKLNVIFFKQMKCEICGNNWVSKFIGKMGGQFGGKIE